MDNWTTRFTSSRIAPGVFNFKTADDEPRNFLEQLLADLGLPTATSQSMFSNGYRSTPILGYARISTQDQDASLQIQALEAAGCLKVYIDNASGSTTKRPELDKLDMSSAFGSVTSTGSQIVVDYEGVASQHGYFH